MSDYAYDIDVINTLIGSTIDSADGYAEAAKGTKNPYYSETFEQWAAERERVADHLQQRVRQLGGLPNVQGSVLASAHRVLMHLRRALKKGDAAIIEEIERGEAHIQKHFERALKDDALSEPSVTAIEHALVSIKAGHGQALDLKQTVDLTAAD